MSYPNNEQGNKRFFNVLLDSNVTSSFTGIQHDAYYNINLKELITDHRDLDRPYKMSFYYRSVSALGTTSTLTMNEVYLLALNVGKGRNTISNYNSSLLRNVIGVLDLKADLAVTNTVGATTTASLYFDSKHDDNQWIYLKNLVDVTQIHVSLLKSTDLSVFNSANNGPINTSTLYTLLLRFEQL